MALTLTHKVDPKIEQKLGHNYQLRVVSVAFDASYPTGGEVLDLSTLMPDAIEFVFAHPAAGYVFEYDYENKKLKAFYADYDAAADGVLIEVANEADLSAVSTVLIAIGR